MVALPMKRKISLSQPAAELANKVDWDEASDGSHSRPLKVPRTEGTSNAGVVARFNQYPGAIGADKTSASSDLERDDALSRSVSPAFAAIIASEPPSDADSEPDADVRAMRRRVANPFRSGTRPISLLHPGIVSARKTFTHNNNDHRTDSYPYRPFSDSNPQLVAYDEFQGTGNPPDDVGRAGDVYLDLTPWQLKAYFRGERGWQCFRWPEDKHCHRERIQLFNEHPLLPGRYLWIGASRHEDDGVGNIRAAVKWYVKGTIRRDRMYARRNIESEDYRAVENARIRWYCFDDGRDGDGSRSVSLEDDVPFLHEAVLSRQKEPRTAEAAARQCVVVRTHWSLSPPRGVAAGRHRGSASDAEQDSDDCDMDHLRDEYEGSEFSSSPASVEGNDEAPQTKKNDPGDEARSRDEDTGARGLASGSHQVADVEQDLESPREQADFIQQENSADAEYIRSLLPRTTSSYVSSRTPRSTDSPSPPRAVSQNPGSKEAHSSELEITQHTQNLPARQAHDAATTGPTLGEGKIVDTISFNGLPPEIVNFIQFMIDNNGRHKQALEQIEEKNAKIVDLETSNEQLRDELQQEMTLRCVTEAQLRVEHQSLEDCEAALDCSQEQNEALKRQVRVARDALTNDLKLLDE